MHHPPTSTLPPPHLIFMEGHLVTIMNDNTRNDWCNYCDCMSFEVDGSDNEEKYAKGMPEDIIPCFWRDLLLVAISQNHKSVLKAFKEHHAGRKPNSMFSINSLTERLPLFLPGPKHEEYAR